MPCRRIARRTSWSRPGNGAGSGSQAPTAVPPAPGVVVVPARVDAKYSAPACAAASIEREQLLGRRIAHEGVHVVVEDHREPAGSGWSRRSHGVVGEFAEGGVQHARTGPDEDGGNGPELLAGREEVAPLVVGVVGAEQGDVGRALAFAGLETPSRAGLDLPEPGAPLPVGERADREVAAGGPAALRGTLEAAASLVAVGDLCSAGPPARAARPARQRHSASQSLSAQCSVRPSRPPSESVTPPRVRLVTLSSRRGRLPR